MTGQANYLGVTIEADIIEQKLLGHNGGFEALNMGGCSDGKSAVINKRAGGMGLISGRKAFQRPMKECVAILNAIQDVYRDSAATVA